MFHEVRIIGEVLVLAVLKYKDAAFLQQPFLKDEAGDGGQFLECIGRIGKDEVEALLARLDEAEGVATQRHAYVGAEFLHACLYKAVVVAIQLDADDVGTASRHQFERDAACAGEEVEDRCAFEVEIARQHIEDILLGKIRRRSCLEGLRNIEVPAFIDTRDDSHLPFTNKVIRS